MIVVLGSTNTDMVVSGAKIPVPGETVCGGSFMMNPGGKGANQAVAVNRLSAQKGACVFIALFGLLRSLLVTQADRALKTSTRIVLTIVCILSLATAVTFTILSLVQLEGAHQTSYIQANTREPPRETIFIFRLCLRI